VSARQPDALRAEIASVERASTYLVRALLAVAIGALVFTMVNVTLFATAEGVHPLIAWMLDPLASVAMMTILLAEATLSRHGRKAGAWPTALKWAAGLATWAMNTWTSLIDLSAAGLLLHSVAPAIVLLLAEATPRIRRRFAEILTGLRTELERAEAESAEQRSAAERQSREHVASLASVLAIGTRLASRPAPARQVVTPAPRQSKAPAKRQPVKQAPDLAELTRRARSLPNLYQLGRKRLAEELGITQHWARQVLEELDGEQTHTQRPVALVKEA